MMTAVIVGTNSVINTDYDGNNYIYTTTAVNDCRLSDGI